MSNDHQQSPSSQIGVLAQELMEQIERETPGARLDQLVICAALTEDGTDDDQTMHVQLVSDSTDPFSVIGMLNVALEMAKGQITGE